MTTSFYIIAVYNSVNYCILFVTRETFNMNKFYLDVDSIIEYKKKNIYFLGLDQNKAIWCVFMRIVFIFGS